MLTTVVGGVVMAGPPGRGRIVSSPLPRPDRAQGRKGPRSLASDARWGQPTERGSRNAEVGMAGLARASDEAFQAGADGRVEQVKTGNRVLPGQDHAGARAALHDAADLWRPEEDKLARLL